MTASWLPRALALVDAARDAPPDPDLGNPTETACEHGCAALRVLAEAGLPEPTKIDRTSDGLGIHWWMRDGYHRRLVLDVDNDEPDDEGNVGCVFFEWFEHGTRRFLVVGHHPDRLAMAVPAMRLTLGGFGAHAVRQALIDAGVPPLGWNPDECDWNAHTISYDSAEAYLAVEQSKANAPACAQQPPGTCLP